MSRDIKEYFDNESSIYERIRWRGNFVTEYDFDVTKEALRSLMDNDSEFFLDIGCGPGIWLEEFCTKKKICVGIDISDKMLKICKRKHLPNVDLVVADCHKLPFRDEIFTSILSSRVFIYLRLEEALKEVKRVLKEKNCFILLVQIERKSLYFKLWRFLKKSKKFLENANYLTAYDLIERVSKHFQVKTTKGVIFHEHISMQASSLPFIIFILNYLYLKPMKALEMRFSNSFFKYFYASSIAMKLCKGTDSPRKEFSSTN